jgi:hypothetical protein
MGQAREALDKLTRAATEAHSLDAVMAMYSDDAVLSTPDAGEIKGRTGIESYWRQFIDGFPDATYEYLSKIEAGNKAVDEGWYVGTNTGVIQAPSGETISPTGKAVRLRSCDIATVDAGKITEHHLYFDDLEFQQQMGLSEATR